MDGFIMLCCLHEISISASVIHAESVAVVTGIMFIVRLLKMTCFQ